MKKRFKKAYVEITSGCNLQCSFCPPTKRPAASMNVDQFRRVANEISPLTSHVYFHVKGEPLLHPKLKELIDVAHGLKLRVHLVTNGTLIASQADLLAGHPALHKITFSLHSFEAESTGAKPSDYLDPILEFVRRSENSGCIVALRYWKGAQTPKTGFRLGPRTYLNYDAEFAWPSLDDPVSSLSGFCHGLRDQVAILVDGTVVPCCLDGEGVIRLGNVFQDSLESILAGPRATALYQGFSENRCVEPLCQRCRFRDRFTSQLKKAVIVP